MIKVEELRERERERDGGKTMEIKKPFLIT